MYTTVQRFGNRNIFFKEINIFIQQECIKLIKSDSKDIYNHITSCIKQFKSIRLQWIIAWNYGSSNWENTFFKPFLQKYIAKKIFFTSIIMWINKLW